MDMLYHYTKVETLYKIISNEYNGNIRLRANFFMNMNDPYDCRYLISEISRLASIDKNQKHNKDDFQDAIKKVGIPYFISFSSKGDNLPMWKMYGDNGHGVVLGFDKEEIKESIKHFQNLCDNKDRLIALKCFCKLYDCKYWNENEIKEQFGDEYSKTLKVLKENAKKDVVAVSYLVKSPYYQYEDETRIVFLYAPSNRIAPDYINFYIPINSIKIIKAGPCVDSEYVRAFVPDCLKDKVEKSDIPYTDRPRYVSPDLFNLI